MTPGKRFGLSAAQKDDMWRRWKTGQSLHEIGRAFGKEHSSIRCLVSRNGGIVPAVRRCSLRVLTVVEREASLEGSLPVPCTFASTYRFTTTSWRAEQMLFSQNIQLWRLVSIRVVLRQGKLRFLRATTALTNSRAKICCVGLLLARQDRLSLHRNFSTPD
jgi:hypothetical protein